MLGNFNPQYKTKGELDRPKTTTDVQNSSFKKWRNDHMYRTSTHDMSIRKSVTTKQEHIPGYSGYIPGRDTEGLPGRTFAQLTVELFNRDKFMPMKPWTTVHRAQTRYGKFGGGLPDEYHALSHKHGGMTIPIKHPSLDSTFWKSTIQSSFENPEKQRFRLFRFSNVEEQKKVPIKKTEQSGFANNFKSEFQQTVFAWKGMDRPQYTYTPGSTKNIHNIFIKKDKDYFSTEYRAKMNPEKPFHPPPFMFNIRKIKKPSKL